MAKKNDDLFLVGMEFAGNQTFKLVKFGSKHTGKALICIIKATITEIKEAVIRFDINHFLADKILKISFQIFQKFPLNSVFAKLSTNRLSLQLLRKLKRFHGKLTLKSGSV